MISIERLMKPSPKDLAGVLCEYFRYRQQVQNAATPLTAGFTLPPERMLLVQSVSVQLTPGAGQTARSALVQHAATGDGSYILLGAKTVDPGIGAGVESFHSLLEHEILVVPGTMAIMGNFSAAGVANTIIVGVTGWLIPRGSVVY